MSEISPILRRVQDDALSFWCPGCNQAHVVRVGEGQGPRWDYNGSPASPTFTPSVLVRRGHYVTGHQGSCYCTWDLKDESNFKCGICHSFVTDGRIQFLDDCTHPLAGQTVDLPEFPA